MSAVLRLEDLRVSFGTRQGPAHVVNGLSYELGRGETVALVGESGSGKSVSSLALLQLLPMPPAVVTGAVHHTDSAGVTRDLLSLSPSEIRSIRGNEISMIFQDPMTSLNPVLTIGAQIMEPLQLHRGMDNASARRRVLELLDTVGIPSPDRRIDQYPHQLSGGMRQRVMIAIGIACEPAVLIADEPTTALDVTTQAQIIDELSRLQARMGMSVVWITHDLGVVAGIADRVVVMYGGQMMEQASVDDLFAHRRNPYTRGLLASLPELGRERPHRLQAIAGLPPDPIAMPTGCPFSPRCHHGRAACATELPEVRVVEGDHRSLCHFTMEELDADD
jgi:oligopeptide/dipeptide ABC transporter ATP-binding protein